MLSILQSPVSSPSASPSTSPSASSSSASTSASASTSESSKSTSSASTSASSSPSPSSSTSTSSSLVTTASDQKPILPEYPSLKDYCRPQYYRFSVRMRVCVNSSICPSEDTTFSHTLIYNL